LSWAEKEHKARLESTGREKGETVILEANELNSEKKKRVRLSCPQIVSNVKSWTGTCSTI
jgi:hypothetical protein